MSAEASNSQNPIRPISDEDLKCYGLTRQEYDALDEDVRRLLAMFCLIPLEHMERTLAMMAFEDMRSRRARA